MTEGRPISGDPGSARPASRLQRTRISAAWTATAVGLLLLAVILVFIVQNLDSVEVRFIAFEGSLPLGVALLLAVLLGGLLTITIGTVRILQLRRVARRHRAADRP